MKPACHGVARKAKTDKGFASCRCQAVLHNPEDCFIRQSRASFIFQPLQVKQLRYEAFACANMKHKRLKPLV